MIIFYVWLEKVCFLLFLKYLSDVMVAFEMAFLMFEGYF